jgi:hypothetical protein
MSTQAVESPAPDGVLQRAQSFYQTVAMPEVAKLAFGTGAASYMWQLASSSIGGTNPTHTIAALAPAVSLAAFSYSAGRTLGRSEHEGHLQGPHIADVSARAGMVAAAAMVPMVVVDAKKAIDAGAFNTPGVPSATLAFALTMAGSSALAFRSLGALRTLRKAKQHQAQIG